MTKVNSFKQGSLLLFAFVGFISSTYAQCTSPVVTGCAGFKTYTQGGWGSGSNSRSNSTPGNWIKNYFATLYPAGLEIGCTNKLKLTSASALTAFLPSGGTPNSLPSGTLTNPTSYGNTFAGQLVAATLNVKYDDAIPSFSSSNLKLKDLVIASGTFAGWTVQNLLLEANKRIGGCTSSFTFSQFTTALDNINQNYDNGSTNKNFLNCPPTCSNVTNGGTIGANEAKCGSFDPAEIYSCVAASGGTGTLQYAWYSSSNGTNWNLISGANSASYNPSMISTSTYFKRVAKRSNCTDFIGNSNVICKIVNPIPSASTVSGVVNVKCFAGLTGSVNLNVSGGTPAYSFVWNNGSTSEDLSGLGKGTYNVVVTDSKGCKANASAMVDAPASAVSASATATNIGCFAGLNGSVNLTVSGGTAGYTFAWNNGATTEDLSGVGAGTYNVVVTDANGCKANASATVNGPSSAVSASAAATKVNCFGGLNGSVNLTVMGGTAGYTFAWDNGATTEDLSGVGAGTYNVVVTDANGCTANASATVNGPSSPVSASVNATSVTCFGDMNGSVNLIVSGGTAGYTFAWDNGATTEDLSGVGAGTYNVVVTDANGCTANASATVEGPSAALAGTAVTTSNVKCYLGSTGAINLTVAGGTTQYTFLWSNGSTSEDLTGLPMGVYSVTITDANGCTATASSEVTQPAVLTLSGTTSPASSCQCNGKATLSVSGGTEPYSYAWSNGTTGVSELNTLCKGASASVVVTDANGCSAPFSFSPIGFQGGCNGTKIIEFNQGPRADGSAVDLDRSNPELAKGAPQNTNLPGTFYSLGFGGYVVVEIGGGIYNRPGNDLRVVETTYWAWGCQRYAERARVYISTDNVTWVDKGEICQDGEFDIWPLQCIRYVKIVDTSVPETFVNEPILADGFDVDGIECIGATSGRAAVSADDSQLDNSSTTRFTTRSLNLFPNPADALLNVELTGSVDNEIIRLMIIDQVGRVVKSMEVTTGAGQFRMEIPIQDLNRGMYSVSVTGTNLNINQKIIKK